MRSCPSDPNLKFITFLGKGCANFRFISVTSNYRILAQFMDLKYTPARTA